MASATLNDSEQIKTFKDFLSNYNKLSELCFTDCVWDFTNRKVSKAEESCAVNCAEKFLKTNQRISTRFQEFQMIANENAMAAMNKSGAFSN
jgi:import inner membrane translocase subunit TIM9